MANPVGRPTKYSNEVQLNNIIQLYFKECDEHTKQIYSEKLGDVVTIADPLPYTMSGLARRIGLSRQAVMEYKNSDKFGDTIKYARQIVEEYVETRLMAASNSTGPIFNLKCNFNWRDNLDDAGKPQPNPIYFVNNVPTKGEPTTDK